MDELKITGKMSTPELARHPNVAEEMDKEDLKLLGQKCRNDLDINDASRARWKEWYARALKLAMQVAEAKNYPWPNASNVKFPLLTVASMGYHARAYPTVVNGRNLVKCVVVGYDDERGSRKARADRVGQHMSYQMLEMTDWEQVTDASLLAQAILGTTFKKFWYDRVRMRRAVKLVYAENLVVDYYTTDLKSSRCVTELYDFNGNDLYERIASGLFIDAVEDMEDMPPPQRPAEDPIAAAREKSQKMTKPQAREDDDLYPFAEQYCYFDFDGDGYKEPYVVSFRRDTGTVFRVVSRFYEDDIEWTGRGEGRKVLRITGEMPFVKKGFIPSPDGGFYDLGFGALMGPINESVDTSINQMFDAGHLRNMGGGFLGRGVRVKGGEINIRMNGWIRVDSTGDDLKKNIMPHQMPEPSDALFKLMVFLIEYAQRIASANDVQMGENPGQNTPAETMRTMSENGRLIFNALFKREWKSTAEELRMFYELNRRHPIFTTPEDREIADFFKIVPEDYFGTSAGIYPACDPTVTTSQERVQQANLLRQNMTIPGHDIEAVMRRVYETWNVPNVGEIYPGIEKMKDKPQMPPNPQLLQAQAKLSDAQTKAHREQHQAMIAQGKLIEQRNNFRLKIATLLDEHAMNTAKIAETQARIALLRAQAKSEGSDAALQKQELELKRLELHNNTIIEATRLLQDIVQGMTDGDAGQAGGGGGGQPGEAGMAPVAPQPQNAGVPQLSGPPQGGGAGAMGAGGVPGQ